MKEKNYSIFSQIGILVFAIITILSLLFMWLTYLSVSNFHEASTQLLNKDVAAHIARFTSPFINEGIDKKKADSVFYDAMVLSPSVEVYFLDTTGKVIAYHDNENPLQSGKISVDPLRQLIATRGEKYIKGPDPRERHRPKIFSAAEVRNGSKLLGYIYVILGSNRNLNQMLFSTYFNGLLFKVLIAIVLLSIIFAFVYINRLRRNYDSVLQTLDRFQQGDFSARFNVKKYTEMTPVTTTFNTMADLLVLNIDKLTQTGKERKEFIANISHDLRTPLSVARGYTETLLMTTTQPALMKEEYLQLVYRKIRQVEDMVMQLFDLSRIDSVEFNLKKEPFVFSEVLQEIVYESGAAAQEKEINLDDSQIKNSDWILADIKLMERVIENLMVNALKYTPAQGIIKVEIEKENELLSFSISNSGVDITPQVNTWFNSTEKDVFASRPPGIGLGLLIVKKILMLHGFNYQLRSHEDGLNSFTISMPLHHNAAELPN
ncbi:MAG: HAMP domain-containing sensor histidine kinase [Ferruginibacter sp.]|nr:HAMP domain-containing sensor histidine kinase [Ferruginibacter sp.]